MVHGVHPRLLSSSRRVKPNIVEACIQEASNISECTQQEFSALSVVQQERRERDAALLDLLQLGNREQFAHESGVLSELDNGNTH